MNFLPLFANVRWRWPRSSALTARRSRRRDLRCISPVPPRYLRCTSLYHRCISTASPLHLRCIFCISTASPLHLRCISPYLPQAWAYSRHYTAAVIIGATSLAPPVQNTPCAKHAALTPPEDGAPSASPGHFKAQAAPAHPGAPPPPRGGSPRPLPRPPPAASKLSFFGGFVPASRSSRRTGRRPPSRSRRRRPVWLKMASTLSDDTAPSARLLPPGARAAPTHPGAPPGQLGSLRAPQLARLRLLRR